MKVYFKPVSAINVLIGALCVSILLILVITVEQQRIGQSEAIRVYVNSFFVFWNFKSIGLTTPVFPGGYLVMAFFIVVFLARLFTSTSFTVSGIGKALVNIGLIVLLGSYLYTNISKTETQALLKPGERLNYGDDVHAFEVALVTDSENENERVFAIPQRMLERSQTIRHDDLPFSIRVDDFVLNSIIRERDESLPQNTRLADQDKGDSVYSTRIKNSKLGYKNNTPSVYVILFNKEESIGTWLLHEAWEPQRFEYKNKQYSLHLRARRIYYPFEVRFESFEASPGSTLLTTSLIGDNIQESNSKETVNGSNHFGYHIFLEDNLDENQASKVFVKRIPGKTIPLYAVALISVGLILILGSSQVNRKASPPAL